MKNQKRKWSLTAAGMLATLTLGATAYGQSADALIDKLVDKGILTVKEANDLREETDKGFNQAAQVKSGIPDWITSFKLGGDLRGRYEGIYTKGENSADRNRFRYRLRFGLTASMTDDLEVGFRLASGTLTDPISPNQTMGGNAVRKTIGIDLAYAKWTPLHKSDWTGTFVGGKMENPFVFSDLVFDPDYMPEGLAQQFGYAFSDKQSLKFMLGEFVLDEIGASSKDPFLVGAQLRLDSVWTKKLQTSFGVAALAISGKDTLSTGGDNLMHPGNNVPNVNVGNTRTPVVGGVGGNLVYNYNPIVVDGALIYTLDSFPLYKGVFPIKLAGEYMNNPGASANNQAYSVGIQFGKSGKKGLWDISYNWKYLEADAWWEELVDSDFGGFYAVAPPGGSQGFQCGTGVRGHIIKATFSPYDSLTFGAKFFMTELINPYPAGSKSGASRIQLDAAWRF